MTTGGLVLIIFTALIGCIMLLYGLFIEKDISRSLNNMIVGCILIIVATLAVLLLDSEALIEWLNTPI